MSDLVGVKYGTVVGRFLAIVPDSNDTDTNPDAAPLTGSVVFAAVPKSLLVAGASPAPATLLPTPITAVLDDAGYLTWNGVRGVRLVATDDTETNPSGFTYLVSFGLKNGNVAIPYGPFNVAVPANTITDLTLSAPVSASGGTIITTGPAGPQGPPGLPWRGMWSSATTYVLDDLVVWNGLSYIALRGSLNKQPDTSTSDWETFTWTGGSLILNGGGGTGAVYAADILDSTQVGRDLLMATDQAAARAVIGAGTGSGTGTVSSSDITDATVVGKGVLTAATAAAARAAIGAGTSSSDGLGTTVILYGDVARNHPVTGVALPPPPNAIVIWVSNTQPTHMVAGSDIWMNGTV